MTESPKANMAWSSRKCFLNSTAHANRCTRQLTPKKGLPRLTIIVCGKRHKTKFDPTTEQDYDRPGNAKPGTVGDAV